MARIELPTRPVGEEAPSFNLSRPKPARKGAGPWKWIVVVVVLAGLAGGTAFALRQMNNSTADGSQFQTEKVLRRDLRVVVTQDGNVESSANLDLKCRVEGGSQILWIIPDGTPVKIGDKLVTLSSSAIQEKISAQQIVVERGEATVFSAAEDLAVAEIAFKEYVDGTFLKDLQTAESAIIVQEQNVKTADNLLNHSELMFRKGHINQLQLESNRDSVERAKLDLAAAKTSRKVLVDFTKPKMVKQLESARDAAKAKLEAEKRAFKLEKEKLARLNEQLSYCTIIAPQAGTVIYANENSFRRESTSIEEGSAIKEFQTILRLPDLSKMQVKAMVHETKVGRIRNGMPAAVKIRDREFKGKVTQVMSQAESRGWFSSVKEYAAFVSIENATDTADLKPNMTAEVSILVREVKSVLTTPLQAVVEKGGKFFGYVRATNAKGYVERELMIGDNNDKHIEIKDGLKEGDEIILNPRATCEEAREQVQGPETSDGLALPSELNSASGEALPVGPLKLPKGDLNGPPPKGGKKPAPSNLDPKKVDELKRRKAVDEGPRAESKLPSQQKPAA